MSAPKSALTVAQVAERLGTRTHTVTAWIKSGELRAIDISQSAGGRPTWRIMPEDLDAFIERRTHQAAPKRTRRKKRSNIKEFF